MTHAEASEQLSAYLDGELTDGERAELEAQLARDPALRSELAQIEAAVTFLRTHGPVQAPPEFRDKVLAAVKDEPMPGGWWRWLRRPFGLPVEGLAVALAAALVLIIALPLGLHQPATQVKDLAADPYGFVKGEETRSAPASSLTTQPQAAQKKGKAAPAAPPAPDEDLAGEPQAQVPAPTATPNAPVAGTGTGTSSNQLAKAPRSDLADASKTPPNAQAPAPTPGTVYAYTILTRDADVLSKLRRIAKRYKGMVLDARGRPATGPLQPGAQYTVEIPSGALAPFGDDLRTLGMVTEIPQPSNYAAGVVKVQIAFDLATDKSNSLPRAATEQAQ